MTDLERRLVASLNLSADLLEEWIPEASPAISGELERQGGQAVAVFRYLASVIDVTGMAR